MKSTNYPNIDHAINIEIEGYERIKITLPDGKLIATITVNTMEKTIQKNGKYKTIPSENFWVCFNAEDYSVSEQFADAILSPCLTKS